MSRQTSCASLILGAALTLSACGGGGGGTNVAFNPPPPTGGPPPPPPPPPTGLPLPPAHLGLTSSQPFAVRGVGDTYTTNSSGVYVSTISGPAFQNVQFSYDAATNGYLISLPGFDPGALTATGYNGSADQVATSTFSRVAGSGGTLQTVGVLLPVPGSSNSPYTYTSLGTWDGQTGVTSDGSVHEEGIFAYGIPTAAGNVPTSGSATYTAQIVGTQGAFYPNAIGGDVSLNFNFGAGTLSGSMHPQIIDGFDGIFVDFGRFDFRNTVYSTGSTTFSGQFVVPGLPDADSAFDGNFTGPNAAELMARFQTPYILNGQQGTISGIWIGRRP